MTKSSITQTKRIQKIDKKSVHLPLRPEARSSQWRVYAVFFLFIAASLVMIFKLFSLQVLKGDYYEAMARGQQVSLKEDQALRGDILLLDSSFPLTQVKTKNVIYVFPSKIEPQQYEAEAKSLAEILGEKTEDWFFALQKGEAIKKEVTDVQREAFQERKLDSVILEKTKARFYPQKDFASHVIGFVGTEGVGQYGLEGYYDDLLRGDSTISQTGRSPLGYLTSLEPEEEKQQKGAELWLTLDYKIQYLAEKLLKQAKADWQIDSGQIIVQDPSTGKILAMANYPSFDPNDYGNQNDFDIFLNKALQTTFEPGSIFKPVTMAAGLEEGLVTPETTYEDTGSVNVGGPSIYNFAKHIFGVCDMTMVLKQSINTGVVLVESKLGGERFLRYVSKFGFFDKTGIDLQGEVCSENKTLKNGYPRDFATASFGQGIEATPLQMVQSFSIIANKGKLMKPYIVAKIVKPDGQEIITQPKVVREVISEKTADQLSWMLEKVVSEGSGRKAKIQGYQISGKTGTAQVIVNGRYSEDNTTQSFLGFFPSDNPRAVVLVKLDNPKNSLEAGSSATPIGREMIKNMIDLWQIPPTEPVSD
ncbi:MAG: penicillin-binding protein 2 [Candidatus Pacebacteria bacterium]|nr:penicillin-binding protein 2 [Candidatus Paceibacterota bacterium]